MGRTHRPPESRRHVWCVGVAAVIAMMTLFAWQLPAAPAPDPGAVTALESFLARPATSHEYRAARRLEANGVGREAWLDAQTHFTVASGLMYDVKGEGGSGYIRRRVLHLMLEEEQQLIADGQAHSVALSPANYRFTPESINDEGLAVVRIKPLRKERPLIDGQMFLTPLEGDLVRVKGRLAKNPSFWVTRVDLVRSYRRINGALMVVLLESTARLRMLGSSDLRMTYSYSHIDEQPVEPEPAD